MTKPLNLDLLAQVIDVLADEGLALRSQMEPHAVLDGDMGMKHIDLIDMHLVLEDQFDIEIEHRAEEEWKTLADVVRSVEQAIATPRYHAMAGEA